MKQSKWEKDISKFLVGKTIKKIEYLTEQEANECGWNQIPLVIIFDDNSYIFPMADDEGNNGGSIHTNIKELPIIPVIY